jgi:hypothetical protein
MTWLFMDKPLGIVSPMLASAGDRVGHREHTQAHHNAQARTTRAVSLTGNLVATPEALAALCQIASEGEGPLERDRKRVPP